jgi:hypothetical protein
VEPSSPSALKNSNFSDLEALSMSLSVVLRAMQKVRQSVMEMVTIATDPDPGSRYSG